jgi:hypothetical protein
MLWALCAAALAITQPRAKVEGGKGTLQTDQQVLGPRSSPTPGHPLSATNADAILAQWKSERMARLPLSPTPAYQMRAKLLNGGRQKLLDRRKASMIELLSTMEQDEFQNEMDLTMLKKKGPPPTPPPPAPCYPHFLTSSENCKNDKGDEMGDTSDSTTWPAVAKEEWDHQIYEKTETENHVKGCYSSGTDTTMASNADTDASEAPPCPSASGGTEVEPYGFWGSVTTIKGAEDTAATEITTMETNVNTLNTTMLSGTITGAEANIANLYGVWDGSGDTRYDPRDTAFTHIDEPVEAEIDDYEDTTDEYVDTEISGTKTTVKAGYDAEKEYVEDEIERIEQGIGDQYQTASADYASLSSLISFTQADLEEEFEQVADSTMANVDEEWTELTEMFAEQSESLSGLTQEAVSQEQAAVSISNAFKSNLYQMQKKLGTLKGMSASMGREAQRDQEALAKNMLKESALNTKESVKAMTSFLGDVVSSTTEANKNIAGSHSSFISDMKQQLRDIVNGFKADMRSQSRLQGDVNGRVDKMASEAQQTNGEVHVQTGDALAKLGEIYRQESMSMNTSVFDSHALDEAMVSQWQKDRQKALANIRSRIEWAKSADSDFVDKSKTDYTELISELEAEDQAKVDKAILSAFPLLQSNNGFDDTNHLSRSVSALYSQMFLRWHTLWHDLNAGEKFDGKASWQWPTIEKSYIPYQLLDEKVAETDLAVNDAWNLTVGDLESRVITGNHDLDIMETKFDTSYHHALGNLSNTSQSFAELDSAATSQSTNYIDENFLKFHHAARIAQSRLQNANRPIRIAMHGSQAELPVCQKGDILLRPSTYMNVNGAGEFIFPETSMEPMIFYDGDWQPICSDMFWNSNQGAEIMCHQLGLKGGTVFPYRSSDFAYTNLLSASHESEHGVWVGACTRTNADGGTPDDLSMCDDGRFDFRQLKPISDCKEMTIECDEPHFGQTFQTCCPLGEDCEMNMDGGATMGIGGSSFGLIGKGYCLDQEGYKYQQHRWTPTETEKKPDLQSCLDMCAYTPQCLGVTMSTQTTTGCAIHTNVTDHPTLPPEGFFSGPYPGFGDSAYRGSGPIMNSTGHGHAVCYKLRKRGGKHIGGVDGWDMISGKVMCEDVAGQERLLTPDPMYGMQKGKEPQDSDLSNHSTFKNKMECHALCGAHNDCVGFDFIALKADNEDCFDFMLHIGEAELSSKRIQVDDDVKECTKLVDSTNGKDGNTSILGDQTWTVTKTDSLVTVRRTDTYSGWSGTDLHVPCRKCVAVGQEFQDVGACFFKKASSGGMEFKYDVCHYDFCSSSLYGALHNRTESKEFHFKADDCLHGKRRDGPVQPLVLFEQSLGDLSLNSSKNITAAFQNDMLAVDEASRDEEELQRFHWRAMMENMTDAENEALGRALNASIPLAQEAAVDAHRALANLQTQDEELAHALNVSVGAVQTRLGAFATEASAVMEEVRAKRLAATQTEHMARLGMDAKVNRTAERVDQLTQAITHNRTNQVKELARYNSTYFEQAESEVTNRETVGLESLDRIGKRYLNTFASIVGNGGNTIAQENLNMRRLAERMREKIAHTQDQYSDLSRAAAVVEEQEGGVLAALEQKADAEQKTVSSYTTRWLDLNNKAIAKTESAYDADVQALQGVYQTTLQNVDGAVRDAESRVGSASQELGLLAHDMQTSTAQHADHSIMARLSGARAVGHLAAHVVDMVDNGDRIWDTETHKLTRDVAGVTDDWQRNLRNARSDLLQSRAVENHLSHEDLLALHGLEDHFMKMKEAVQEDLVELASDWDAKRNNFTAKLDEHNQDAVSMLAADIVKKKAADDLAKQALEEAGKQITSVEENQKQLTDHINLMTNGEDVQVSKYFAELNVSHQENLDALYRYSNTSRNKLVKVVDDVEAAAASWMNFLEEQHNLSRNHTQELAQVHHWQIDPAAVHQLDSESKVLDESRLQLRRWLASFYDADHTFDTAVRSKFQDYGHELSDEVHSALQGLRATALGGEAQSNHARAAFQDALQKFSTESQSEVSQLYFETNHAIDRIMASSALNAKTKAALVTKLQSDKEALATTLLNEEGTVQDRQIALATQIAHLQQLTQDALRMGNNVILQHFFEHDFTRVTSAARLAQDRLQTFNNHVSHLDVSTSTPSSLLEDQALETLAKSASEQEDTALADVMMADADTQVERMLSNISSSALV